MGLETWTMGKVRRLGAGQTRLEATRVMDPAQSLYGAGKNRLLWVLLPSVRSGWARHDMVELGSLCGTWMYMGKPNKRRPDGL